MIGILQPCQVNEVLMNAQVLIPAYVSIKQCNFAHNGRAFGAEYADIDSPGHFLFIAGWSDPAW